MKYDYYYGAEADQFNFIKIPRVMIAEKEFSDLSLQARILYALLLDRMSLSRKNEWFDDDNRVFIVYPIADIQSDLGFTRKKAMEYLAELEAFGLVEKKKRGFGLPNIIYVKSFLSQEFARSAENGTTGKVINIGESSSSETDTTSSSPEGTYSCTNSGTYDVPGWTSQEVPESTPLKNKTKKNYIKENQIKSNHILSADGDEMGYEPDQSDVIRAYEEIIKSNIEYDILLQANRFDEELVQGIFELILETVVNKSDTILIASEQYPAALVKSKFLKLNYMHIDYVISCLKKNTTRVKNIKKYLLAALFNAPSTIDGYYKAEVNADMPQFAG